MKVQYQPVIGSDGLCGIHEILTDKDGTLFSVSFEPVRLQTTSFGELDLMLRQIYHQLQTTKPITEDMLDELLFTVEDVEISNEDKVVDIVDFMNRQR